MKKNKQYPNDFKTKLGFFTMNWSSATALVMTTSMFMVYLTDYSGIDQAIGTVGFATALGTTMLLIGRVVDAIDDPLQGWIMDSSKPSKYGKYKPFQFFGIILAVLGTLGLFIIPASVKSSAFVVYGWIGFFYILAEIGFSFHTSGALIQNITYDNDIRTNLTTAMRLGVIAILFPTVFFIPIITVVDSAFSINNIGRSFTIVLVILLFITGILSLLGTSLVKENVPAALIGKKTEMIKLKEIVKMLKENKPLQVHSIATFINAFSFGLSSTVTIYFLKWYYCADLTTGKVDLVLFATLMGINGLLSLVPNLFGPLFANILTKKTNSNIKAFSYSIALSAVGFISIYIMHKVGILQTNPMFFFGGMLIAGIGASTAVVPTLLLWTDCKDYAEYKAERQMSTIIGSIESFLTKAQGALTTVLSGAVLIVAGYSVNAQTGDYAGNLAKVPAMLENFVVFIGLVPFVITIIVIAIYAKFYKLSNTKANEIRAELVSRKSLLVQETE